MSSLRVSLDERLDEWGSRLFNVSREALREHGIEVTTTSRIHRTTHERWKVQHLHDRTTKAKVLDRQQRQSHQPKRRPEVMQHYEQIMKALARSERGEDRQLAADLVRYLGGQGRTPETEKERGKDRER